MNLREDIQAIQEKALEAVNPGNAVARTMQRIGPQLRIGTKGWDLNEFDRVLVLAVGKAAVPFPGTFPTCITYSYRNRTSNP